MWLAGLAAPRHVGSSQTRARTRVPCISRQILNHCVTREAQNPCLSPMTCQASSMLASKLFAEDQTRVVSSKKFRRDFGWCAPILFVFCFVFVFVSPHPVLSSAPSFLLFLPTEEKHMLRPQDKKSREASGFSPISLSCWATMVHVSAEPETVPGGGPD